VFEEVPEFDLSTPEGVLQSAYAALAEATSYEMEYTLETGIPAAEVEHRITGQAVCFFKPFRLKTEVEMQVLIPEQETYTTRYEEYLIDEGERLMLYIHNEGVWQKKPVFSSEISQVLQADAAKDLKLFTDNMKSAVFAGQEQQGEQLADKYELIISGEVAESFLAGLSGIFPPTLITELLPLAGDIQATVWLDAETGLISGYAMNLTDFMRRLTAFVDSYNPTAEEPLTEEQRNTLKKALLTVGMDWQCLIKNIDAATEFTLPDSALGDF
jgi:hypothetical protein